MFDNPVDQLRKKLESFEKDINNLKSKIQKLENTISEKDELLKKTICYC